MKKLYIIIIGEIGEYFQDFQVILWNPESYQTFSKPEKKKFYLHTIDIWIEFYLT